MPTRGALVTIGTTPANLANILRGINAVSGASASRTFGSQLNDQCREIQFQVDSGTVYLGDDSTVSATDYKAKLLTGASERLADAARANSLNLSDFWLLGGAAGAKISVQFTTT